MKSQARQRLNMVLPGEKSYLVIDPQRAESDGAGAPLPGEQSSRPWYGKLWSSVEAADRR